MSSTLLDPVSSTPSRAITPRRISVARAGLGLVWAGAFLVAVRSEVPTTDTELPVAAALVLASYPLIDVVASLLGASFDDRRALRIGAAVSALAVVGIAVAAFGADAGATLVAFGTWAAVSGAIQLVLALRRRPSRPGQLPMIVSGGLSTVAGLSFASAARAEDANLAGLAGYMAFGAVLFLVWARRDHERPAAVSG
ncbi:hypothetical protein KSP35_20565 [Aquihabitans sp. G128]|uniref:DUF308 domain-containing protein n=1 Tax=Aquihabitans sp. G128 TaxID=2849779 RepID=UPI001C21E15A|nr:DUF308 domain-containing protein [Aquihabitans sp. G128]QXC60687.1 hypothetical protein KSP35_20565 [Aquihabitans sp. G128]